MLPVIGLSKVAVRLPGRSEPVQDILQRAGRDAMERKMFAKIHGLRQSPTLADHERMEDLFVAAGRAALDGGPAGLVLYGHTMLTQEFGLRGGFPDRVRSRLGLSESRFFGLSHVNCTSVLRSVEFARRYLARHPDERVLVLGGDHGSVHDMARVIPGIAIGGDGVVGLMVTAAGRQRYRYVTGVTSRDVRFHRNMRMSPREAEEFSKVCCDETVRTLLRAVEAAGMTVDELDWVLPHLSNRMFWGSVSRRAGIPREKVLLDLIPLCGHNFGADALMALDHADRTGRLRPGDRCALVSVAQGAYFHTAIIEVEEDS
jgi:3-oxoacyl-[acyl-carrier-protein] synthase-3